MSPFTDSVFALSLIVADFWVSLQVGHELVDVLHVFG